MKTWWQDLQTGEVHECADHAQARREAIEHLLESHHYVYVSSTRIRPEHAQWWRDAGCPPRPEIRTQLEPVWDGDASTEAEEVWSV